jgi:putative spermidine/putrescine transport system permease protein
LFLFLPLFLIVLTSFNSADTISLPLEVFRSGGSPGVQVRSLVSSLKTSLILAVVASCIGLVIACSPPWPSPGSGKAQRLLLNLFLSPSLIPGIVIGYVLFQFMVVKLAIPLDAAC